MGHAYEPTVVDSSGNSQVNKTALRWVAQHKFKPATVDNAPIDSAIAFRVKYSSDATINQRASNAFIAQYKSVVAATGNGVRETAESGLKALVPKNNFEDAFYALAQYEYFKKWGTATQKLAAIRRAVLYEDGTYKYYSEPVYRYALMSLFNTEIETSRYGDALDTYKKFSQSQKVEPDVQANIASLQNLQTNDDTFSVRGSIEVSNTSWYYKLLKRHFLVLLTSGKLQEIKLRCDKKYALILYTRDIDYTIPEEYGLCGMEVIGDGGTEFALIQS
jgi:hypothetical protein